MWPNPCVWQACRNDDRHLRPSACPATRQVTSDVDSEAAKGEPLWVGQVIHFWFEELVEIDWFAKNHAIDGCIRERFLSLHQRLVSRDGRGANEPRTTLASVIVLDQFSRNLFRNSSFAYAADAIARTLARSAIEKGIDVAMAGCERLFLYLPFEHSEDHADQEYSINLIGQLGRPDWIRSAMKHKLVIDRFGRFPHRNAALNRPSTADELAFLRDPENSF